MGEAEKRDIINLLLTKIFCHSQPGQKKPIHKEYLVMVEMISSQVNDRNMLIMAIGNLFNGKQFFAPQVFENLVKCITKIYDSYLPKSKECREEDFNFSGLGRLKSITKLYYQQNPAARNKVAPCLENQLKRHKIW